MSAHAAHGASSSGGALARGRAVGLLVLLAALFLPWTTAQSSSGVVRANGFDSLGAVALPLMLALWGLAATSLLAASERAARLGVALTNAAVLLAGIFLLAFAHPWAGDPALGAVRVPALVGLLLLALLQAALLRRGSPLAREVAWILAVAAFAAGAVFLYGNVHLPAALSLWVGLATGWAARRRPREQVETLSVTAAAIAVLTAMRFGGSAASGIYLGQYLWIVTALGLIVVSLVREAALRRVRTRA